MIIVASPDKPFSYTAKGSLRRQAIINEYEAEIDATYAAVEESSQENISAPTDWSVTNVINFVREVVLRTMKGNTSALNDDVDLFEMGLDRYASNCMTSSLFLTSV